MSETANKFLEGLLFDIQKFSLHDGPGIRTTVFMKGCPLRCEWCCNPESQRSNSEIMTVDKECIQCGHCIQTCPKGAISVGDGLRSIDWEKCDYCLKCAEVCAFGGIVTTGRYYTCDALLKEIQKDQVFYKTSGGGVTFTGGEPLVQWEFLLTMLQRCKAQKIDTCLDTTGYAPWWILAKLIPYVDLVLYDLKHLDDDRHQERTGVSNRIIIENLIKLTESQRVWLRVPLIPGYNDSRGHVKRIGEFAENLGVEKISLMPYHCWGEQKYERLGRTYPSKDILVPTQDDMENIKTYLRDCGVEVSIGK